MFDDPSLVGCWPTLRSRLDTHAIIGRWSATEPDLAGLDDVAGLLDAWADPARTHPVAQALVRLAAADGGADDDALLLLLHLLSGLVWRLVAQLGDLSVDITAIVLSELTCQIRGYRWRSRHGRLITNLDKDTRRAVLADLRPSDRYHPERVERLTCTGDLTAVTAADPAAADTCAEDIDVVDLLRWATAARGVDAADIALLVESERGRGRRGTGSDAKVAGRYGITRRTLLRRRQRTLTALRDLAGDYLAATA